MGPVPPRGRGGRAQGPRGEPRLRCRLVGRRGGRCARVPGDRPRQGQLQGGRDRKAQHRDRERRQGARRHPWRRAARHAARGRARRRRHGGYSRLRRLDAGRLCGGHALPAHGHCEQAHAAPVHRGQMAEDGHGAPHASGPPRPAGAGALGRAAGHSGQPGWARRGRGGAARDRRRRCGHPQPHRLQASGAGGLVLRPAADGGGDPRPLWPAHRRHECRARAHPHRRRWHGRHGHEGQPAHHEAGGALLRHRPGRRRRQGARGVRPAGVQRHAQDDGRGLEQDAARPWGA